MKNNFEYTKKLYAEYGELVERHCKTELDGYPNLADDCIQNVFLELIEVLDSGVILLSPVKWFIATSDKYINEARAEANCRDLAFPSRNNMTPVSKSRTYYQAVNNESED